MFFRLTQSFADSILLSDIAIQLFNVMARLFSLGGGAGNVFHVSEINDGYDWNRADECKETDVADEPRDHGGGRCTCEIGNRRPEKVLAPGKQDRFFIF